MSTPNAVMFVAKRYLELNNLFLTARRIWLDILKVISERERRGWRGEIY